MAGRIRIMKARPEDLIEVRELWRQVSVEVGVGAPPPTGDGRLFVALDRDRVVGCALVALEDAAMARITDVAVARALRQQGVGRALVEAAVVWSRDRGARSLCVDAADLALGFWRRVGFGGDGPRLERRVLGPADSLTETESAG